MLRHVRVVLALASALFILYLFWKFLNNGQEADAFSNKRFHSVAADDKVTISVYYESLCPDSIKFVRDQLWPTNAKLKSYITLDLVPFGKASYHPNGNTWSFSCQHGQSECRGNKLQACAVKLFKDPQLVMPFVYCVMTSANPPESGKKCSKTAGLDWKQLSQCFEGLEGNNFLHEMGVRTKNLDPTLVFVPWININGNHTNNIQDQALTNLLGLVCRSFQGSPPPGCS